MIILLLLLTINLNNQYRYLLLLLLVLNNNRQIVYFTEPYNMTQPQCKHRNVQKEIFVVLMIIRSTCLLSRREFSSFSRLNTFKIRSRLLKKKTEENDCCFREADFTI